MNKKLTHINNAGHVEMVDISHKKNSERIAIACGKIYMASATLLLIKDNAIKKGNVLTTARIAGIMAAKNTVNLIPLCHHIPLSSIKIDFNMLDNIADSDIDSNKNAAITIIAQAKTIAATGVEMEALTAVNIAALTIYDMCKAVDKEMMISDITLQYKAGGKSGTYHANIS